MSTATIRAKMSVSSVTRNADNVGNISSETVTLNAVYGGSDENKQWSKWTPSGSLTLTINNSDAFGRLLPGQFYFVDMIPTDIKGI